MIAPYTLLDVHYTKDDGSESDRNIIITEPMNDSVRGVDVSSLTLDERKSVVDAFKEYDEYVQTRMSTIFSFTEWADHVQQSLPEVKWRRFNISRLEVKK